MRKLVQGEYANAIQWLGVAAQAAALSTCCRARCGAVLVDSEGRILATSANGRPGNAPMHCSPYAPHLKQGFKSDKTCCVHAEQRVVMEALKLGKRVEGSTMVFARVEEDGSHAYSGRPFCTICSKMALDAGVDTWILEYPAPYGPIAFDAEAYNQLSFQFNGQEDDLSFLAGLENTGDSV